MSDLAAQRIELIMALRSQGIRDRDVLSVIERIPRELFVRGTFEERAYENNALPIECGQTISQPFVVAFMTEKLEVTDRVKVLEVGTGSGYQAAVLSRLARRVYTIERYRTLLKEAEERFAELGITNITTRLGDGLKGWPEQAPFDRIIVTAAADDIPETLVEQLKVGGCMMIPVNRPDSPGVQILSRVWRTEAGFEREDLIEVRFVPLVEGVAEER